MRRHIVGRFILFFFYIWDWWYWNNFFHPLALWLSSGSKKVTSFYRDDLRTNVLQAQDTWRWSTESHSAPRQIILSPWSIHGQSSSCKTKDLEPGVRGKAWKQRRETKPLHPVPAMGTRPMKRQRDPRLYRMLGAPKDTGHRGTGNGPGKELPLEAGKGRPRQLAAPPLRGAAGLRAGPALPTTQPRARRRNTPGSLHREGAFPPQKRSTRSAGERHLPAAAPSPGGTQARWWPSPPRRLRSGA